jgi:hypothetical protein
MLVSHLKLFREEAHGLACQVSRLALSSILKLCIFLGFVPTKRALGLVIRMTGILVHRENDIAGSSGTRRASRRITFWSLVH